MKSLYLVVASFLLTCSCTPDGEFSDVELSQKDGVLLLKVGYQTNEFGGGIEQNVSSLSPETDTIPLKVNYKAPGDFGSIELYHKPGNEPLFKGTIVWMGEGAVSHPVSFKPADDYSRLDTVLPFPGDTRFQIVNIGYPLNDQPDLKPIWNAVANLHIVSEYLKADKKISVLLYTPGVGVGDPAKWDWVLFMSK